MEFHYNNTARLNGSENRNRGKQLNKVTNAYIKKWIRFTDKLLNINMLGKPVRPSSL